MGAALAGFLWLAFIALVFWHDRNKHPVAPEDRPLVERSEHLLAKHLGIDTDRIRRTYSAEVSRAPHQNCVTLRHRGDESGGRFCYRSTDGALLEDRTFMHDFYSPPLTERIAEALGRD